ncbi:MAG: CocE/NonD family hydrolase, partial [Opitutales bacterium]
MQYAEPNELPYRFREIEHCEIPGTDGTQLAAKLWVPEGAEAAPKPAILEFIPYRKRDFKAGRDAANHRYFAGHGYACVRVDMRGSGDSEGVLRDEYLEEEQEDGLAILRWIAAQPWCDGQVGMFGISWGGFNGLQIAARQPSELKAVISVASTDDRYADDVHYMGGCLLGDNLSWATVMLGYNASPPDPALVGDRFLPLWLERLEHSGLWVKNWLQHQTRDAYWKNGSICEAYERVQTPVMAVSGWADGYSNAVFRMAEHLRAPFKGLVGAWGHRYPHFGVPGPAIGFLQECLRWWDYWLKGKPTGVEAEPRLRLFLQHSMPPATAYAERSGHWIAEDTWPSPRITPRRYRMDALGRLETTPAGPSKGDGKRHRWTIQSPLSVGMFSGKWCSFAAAPDLPGDQREEDGGSLVWQTDRLSEPLDVVGAPIVTLSLSANQPQAMVAVRLSDVFPNGKAARVCYGILNLCHRRSHEFP